MNGDVEQITKRIHTVSNTAELPADAQLLVEAFPKALPSSTTSSPLQNPKWTRRV